MKYVLSVLALALITSSANAQQQPKSGKYTGKFGNVLTNQTYELEKGHVYNVQTGHGVFFNDVAGGFIDKTDVVCPGVTDTVDGIIRAGSGYCIVTDGDGDKAFLSYQLKGITPTSNEGTSNGPAALESTLAFRETTFSAPLVSARQRPPQSRGKASGDCPKSRSQK